MDSDVTTCVKKMMKKCLKKYLCLVFIVMELYIAEYKMVLYASFKKSYAFEK